MRSGRAIKIIFSGILFFLFASAIQSFPEDVLQQVSDHCYLLHIEESGENIALVVTEQGTLLFDPPPEPDLSVLVLTLEKVVGKPVRWMVRTGYSPFFTAGVEYFAQQGVVLLTGFRQSESSVSSTESSPSLTPALAPEPDHDIFNELHNPIITFSNQEEPGLKK